MQTSGTPGNGTLVSPSMVEYSNGTTGSVYVYNNVSYPSVTTRLISVFTDNGTTSFPWQKDITIDISNFSTTPRGMTIDSSGNIYMTAPNNALAAEYVVPSGYTAGTVITPTLLGPISAGQTVGVPSIDQTNGHIIVGGQFTSGSNAYGMAQINPAGTSPATTPPTLLVRTNGESNGNAYTINNIVAAPNGIYYATGWFTISSKSYNIIKIDTTNNDAITPIAPANVANGDSTSVYSLTSINIDDSSNIYLSGSFGVTSGGQYNSASLLKIDSSGNYLSYIAAQGSAQGQVGSLSGTNTVSINTHTQMVYVLDTSNSALKAFYSNTGGPSGPSTEPIVAPVVPTVNSNTNTLCFTTDAGFTSTITNQTVASANAGNLPESVTFSVPDGSSSNSSMTTTLTDSNGNKVTVTGANNDIGSSGSFNATATTTSNGQSVSATNGWTITNGGLTSTSSATLTNSDGTISTISSTANLIATGTVGIQYIFDVTTTFPSGNQQSTTLTSNPDGEVCQVLPNIDPNTNYVSTVTVSDGVTSSPTAVVDWTSAPPLTLNLSTTITSFSNSLANNGLGTGNVTVSVQTVTTGYSLAIRGDNLDGTITPADTNMTCAADSTKVYSPTSGTVASPTTLSAGQWGWQLGATATSSNWVGITTSDITFATSATASGPSQDGTAADNYTLWFGAVAGTMTPACTYTGYTVITLVGANS
jgi:hypothetical protein